jgi:hypothetical protein
MKACLVDNKKMVWSEVDEPNIQTNEVLVEIYATALNRADLLQKQGTYPSPNGWPSWPGLELSGVIVAMGETAQKESKFKVGDKVCALVGGGAYAEKIAIPYELLMPIPKNISFEEAAADLGASKFKVFSSVTLPLSKPGIISGVTMVFLPVMSCYVITDAFSGSTGFSLIGKLIAKCFLGEGGAPIQINEGAAIALVMLIIMVVTMSLTGGFKNSENTRGTNL